MCDNRFSRHRTKTACTVEAGIDSREAIANGDSRCFHRRCTILRITTCSVRLGLRSGRLDRSVIPASPIAAYRDAHRLAVGQDT
jgi:hypothetical protein